MSKISVYVRIRPILQHERNDCPLRKLQYDLENQQIRVDISDRKEKCFKFNKVLTEKYCQDDVYNEINMPMLVQRVLDGYHTTIFAYGQTGSGKTFTIQGNGVQQNEGLIPRALEQLFKSLQAKNHDQRNYKVYISYLQIYNENIYDLIDVDMKRPLKMRWNKYQQFIVEDLFQGQCRDANDAMKWWKKGQKNKIMGSHKMNKNSSRSHCILTLRVVSYQFEDPTVSVQSKLQLVDLAGSQRYKTTKSTGAVFKEGIQINKSLFALRQVIAGLYEMSIGEHPTRIVPYRESKLTSLLKQSIGGNTFCTMIACLNPTQTHFQQSLQTLTYASMASYISSAPIKNIDPKSRQNQQLKSQNKHLKDQIEKLTKHIQYLTDLLGQSFCKNCGNKKLPQKGNTQKQFTKTEFLQPLKKENLEQQTSEPTGIINTNNIRKFNSKSKTKGSLQMNKQLQQGSINVLANKTNPKKSADFKAIKTSKDALQSIAMIRDLIHANRSLRQKIQEIKFNSQKQEKQVYNLMRQNQVLRQRWDLVNVAVQPEEPQSQAPIALYQKLVEEQKGLQMRRPSQNSSSFLYKRSNYNQFLQSKSMRKKQQLQSRQKKKTISQFSNRNYNSFLV